MNASRDKLQAERFRKLQKAADDLVPEAHAPVLAEQHESKVGGFPAADLA
jgi:hypothetical protein